MKYTIYRNDLKYCDKAELTSDNIIWDGNLKEIYEKIDPFSLSYRISECERENYTILDLTNLSESSVLNFFTTQFFTKYKDTIQHLFMESCKLSELPNLKEMSKLETLNVNNNNLIKISNLPHSLTELCANNNKLIKINSKLRNILRLDVSHNSLTSCYNLRKCVYLNISHNNICDFNMKSPNMVELNINNNPLINFSTNDMANLKYLDIRHTKIFKINNIDKLVNLIHFNSSYNNLSDIEEMNKLHQLKHLDLIKTIVKYIPYIPKLERLQITDSSDIIFNTKYKDVISKFNINKHNILSVHFDQIDQI